MYINVLKIVIFYYLFYFLKYSYKHTTIFIICCFYTKQQIKIVLQKA